MPLLWATATHFFWKKNVYERSLTCPKFDAQTTFIYKGAGALNWSTVHPICIKVGLQLQLSQFRILKIIILISLTSDILLCYIYYCLTAFSCNNCSLAQRESSWTSFSLVSLLPCMRIPSIKRELPLLTYAQKKKGGGRGEGKVKADHSQGWLCNLNCSPEQRLQTGIFIHTWICIIWENQWRSSPDLGRDEQHCERERLCGAPAPLGRERWMGGLQTSWQSSLTLSTFIVTWPHSTTM